MVWALLLLVITYILVPLLLPVFANQCQMNYRQVPVPTGLGLAFVLPYTLLMTIKMDLGSACLYPLSILFFSILGMLDDWLGSPETKGVIGHFSHSCLSTGVLKACAGIAFSLAISQFFSAAWFDLILNTLLIAATSNVLNLLDLRPGRAGKVFSLVSLLFLVYRPKTLPLLWLLGAVLGYLPWDLREAVMMGDTGSNALGAVLGLAAAMILPMGAKTVAVLLVLYLNWLAEKRSFSQLIASNPILDFIDRLGR